MAIVHQRILELRSKSMQPSRNPVYIECSITEAKAALLGVRHSYIYKDAEFKIEPFYISLINEAVSKGSTFNSCFELVLKYKYETINNCCEINIKNCKRNRCEDGYLVYAYCVFPTCIKLKFSATYSSDKNESMDVIVWSTNNDNTIFTHIKKPDGSVLQKNIQLRGVARDMTKQQLKTSKAYPYRADCVSSLKSMSLRGKTGRDVIPSPSAFRTAKSELKTSCDRDIDPFFDLVKMKREHENVIKFVSIPFAMELTYIPACQFYRKIKTHDMVYFDASGRTCGHPYKKINADRIKKELPPLRESKVLFYTTVAEKKGALLPLNMFVTEEHSAHKIGNHLKNFKIECIVNKIWPIFRKVIIDFSIPLHIALNVAYNDFPANSTMTLYLEYCYEIMTTDAVLKKNFIVVQGCCAHFAKIVSSDLDRFYPAISKKTKHLIQEAMAYATTTNDLVSQVEWWNYFCIIFGSKKFTPQVSQAFENMHSKIMSNDSANQKESTEILEKENAAYHDEKVIYSNSPFYKDFKKASDFLKPTLNQFAHSENEYYVKGLIEHYLKKYMFWTCFWTNSMGYLIESAGEFSNIIFKYEFKQNRISKQILT